MSETALSRQIAHYLEIVGAYHLRLQAGGYRQRSRGAPAGTPDRMAVKDGKVYFIEIKIPGGRVSEVQQQTQRKIEAAGAIFIVAKSVSDVAAVIR